MTARAYIATAGAPFAQARAAVVLLHGRGASADGILSLADALSQHDVAYLAPQAPGGSWYPHSFLAPLGWNEPHLSKSLASVGSIIDSLITQGIEPGRIALMGFSQGGCLALEFVARNPRNYGAVIGLSAGLIGPDGMVRQNRGSLAGTRVLLGCSDIDTHIPLARVYESARVLAGLGADVEARIYPGKDHTINKDEVVRTHALIAHLGRGASVEAREKRAAS